MASRSSSRVAQRCRSSTFFCSRAKKDSIAALSPQAPTRPIEPTSPLLVRARTKAVERNWLPRSECTSVPTAERRTMALRSAATASEASILESME